MKHGQSSVDKFEKFIWKIENYSCLKLNTNEVCSEPFVLGGYPWRILLHNNYNYLAIYLEAVQMETSKSCMSIEWSRDNISSMRVRNPSMGCQYIMTLAELSDPIKGFIVKDVLIVGAEVFVCKSTHDEPVIQAANLYSSTKFGSQNGHMEVEVPRPNPEVEGPKKDSTKDVDAELVSAALGRVLYFLKTRKMKDMNEQACNDLQVLWDELKKFQFDLTWLEPHVQSALEMKSFVEKSLHVEKLKEDMVVLKEKLADAEVNLDAERDLLKSKGFKEIGLDSELGCGSWRRS
ncbi:ubiquitin carboxyl-terminal hydrolase family protein [Trifolium medium]|uniref:Ubiquitin carboxyl-terminal hydrolase family protein n=1 Tax=Trifolium medium TaxID=97028 RepID=A0A392MHI0_9FABA|nr:ubiquitin carboxyl-terminal hydrolase family protein [Trifolium medium]